MTVNPDRPSVDGSGQKVRARLSHSSPGRVRVRVDPEHRSPAEMELLRERLSHSSGVDSVRINPRSGSVLVTGAQTERLRDAVERLMRVVEDAGPEGLPELGVEATVGVVKKVDDQLARLTNSRLRLRTLVPAAFVSLGVRQLLKQGLSVGSVPWYVLIYYGVDSFMKLYPEHAPKASREGTQKETP